VLRHPHEGAARLAAHFSSKPVINAGDGAGQHPTQTLLDLFTIKQQTGNIAGKKVVLVGDLKYGRTAHSLAEALAMFGADLTFVAPPILQMPKETAKQLEKQGIKARLCPKLEEVIADADVDVLRLDARQGNLGDHGLGRGPQVKSGDGEPNVGSRPQGPEHPLVEQALHRVAEGHEIGHR
jgi:aspartate carbamoyltransferase catalytic subunit